MSAFIIGIVLGVTLAICQRSITRTVQLHAIRRESEIQARINKAVHDRMYNEWNEPNKGAFQPIRHP
jgi:hypothetical protein